MKKTTRKNTGTSNEKFVWFVRWLNFLRHILRFSVYQEQPVYTIDIPAGNRVIWHREENKAITVISRAELEKLGKEQLIDLILTLFEQNQALRKEIEAIQGQLNPDSHNSSKPPLSDSYKKPSPKSLRKKSGKKPGHIEGIPRKTKMQPEFEVWLKSIDHTQRTRIIKRLMLIHKKGLFGKKSHDLFYSCPGLYEIVFDDTLRIYFTIEEPYILLEDGSHSKSGGKTTGSQQRVINRVSKRIKENTITNIQWYEEFVTPTELLLSFTDDDPAFSDVPEDVNRLLMKEIAEVISIRTGESIEEILDF
jgi:hypothetical protein